MGEDKRYAFRNNTQGWLAALREDHMGIFKSVSVGPGEIITLTREEQRLTAESHQNPKDNPFIEHEITHYDARTQDNQRTFRAPLLELVENYEGATRPIGVEDEPVLVGSVDDREEVGTPDVAPKGRRRPSSKTKT